jgi:pyridoxamine 5'-phosphate oxidase
LPTFACMSETAQHLIQKLRHEYAHATLDVKDVGSDPFVQFDHWMNEAIRAHIPEPHAMHLATCDDQGQPSVRVVLLRHYDTEGFVFYTNYLSAKGYEIASNPKAAINFFWQAIERQVRISGTLSKLSTETSDAYFASRPYDSQLGAWASNQSEVIESRDLLEEKLELLKKTYSPGNVPRPPHWGGYLLNPHRIEFWQGRPGRVHDRILFHRENAEWKIARLSP